LAAVVMGAVWAALASFLADLSEFAVGAVAACDATDQDCLDPAVSRDGRRALAASVRKEPVPLAAGVARLRVVFPDSPVVWVR
jgi:hypothetical protein